MLCTDRHLHLYCIISLAYKYAGKQKLMHEFALVDLSFSQVFLVCRPWPVPPDAARTPHSPIAIRFCMRIRRPTFCMVLDSITLLATFGNVC